MTINQQYEEWCHSFWVAYRMEVERITETEISLEN